MRSLEIVDEDRMKGYLSYVEETKDEEEIIKKYHYVANSLISFSFAADGALG